MPSVSLSVPRAVLTALSDPVIVTLVRAGDRARRSPVADSSAVGVGQRHREGLALVVLPVSVRLHAGDRAALPTPIVSAAGAVITGRPFTVTAIVVCVAMLPKLSVALTVMVSDARARRCRVSVARSLFTCAQRAGDRQRWCCRCRSPCRRSPTDSRPLVSAQRHREGLAARSLFALRQADAGDRRRLAYPDRRRRRRGEHRQRRSPSPSIVCVVARCRSCRWR